MVDTVLTPNSPPLNKSGLVTVSGRRSTAVVQSATTYVTSLLEYKRLEVAVVTGTVFIVGS